MRKHVFILVAAALLTTTIFPISTDKNLALDLSPKTRLIIEQGDITQKKVDIIVNAANEQLLAGGGVCGAIFNAAGTQELQEACNAHVPVRDDIRCPTGQARITPSFNLQSRGISHIIHAVGPDCRIIKEPSIQDELLYLAVYNGLRLAHDHNAQSIAFPFISSSIYAFPKERAAQIILNAIHGYVRNNAATTLATIHIVLFDEADQQIFIDTLRTNSIHFLAMQKMQNIILKRTTYTN